MIRIISGHLKGKKIDTLPGRDTRPTSDRLRETIFNILNRYPAPKTVIDLFAGTGAFGIEALSRGAAFVYFIDASAKATALIKKNIAACALEKKTKIIKWDIKKNLNCLSSPALTADLVFMDPPYNKGFVYPTLSHLLSCPVLTSQTLVVVEHSAGEVISPEELPCHIIDQRKYGQTMVSFLKPDN